MSYGRVEQSILTSPGSPPYCIHGPTLLFRRFYEKKSSRTFYACSVHRNRKGCRFFHYSDQSLSEDKRRQYKVLFEEYQLSLMSSQTVSLWQCSCRENLGFCIDCNVLFEREGDEREGNGGEGEGEGREREGVVHLNHCHRDRLTDTELLHPTSLLYPVSDSKGQAQYFFSDKTLSFILSEFKRLNISHVICLGTPRLFEALLGSDIKAFLLDIDHRYCQFFGGDVFQRFNMFNGFFYSRNEKGQESLQKFVNSVPKEKVLLIVDPPFGGLMTALRTGIELIWKLIEQECTTLLVFPYFNESHVLESFQDFHMSDYQVTYGNHRYYGDKGKRGKPSPVRIFTNLPLPGLILPSQDGYKYCSICNRYVSSLNSHCSVCNTCTSKDGRLYRHCDSCRVCVKGSYIHCSTCNSCQSTNHDCRQTNKTIGCYICGGLDHKRRHCLSQVEKIRGGRKRHRTNSFVKNNKIIKLKV